MDPVTVNQEVKADSSLIVPLKRKRGRPRKDPSEKLAAKARLQAARRSPGYIKMNRNTPRVDPINDPTGVMIGQTVTGVVEATFDAGFLLAVRIGNSKITLRGAVFKPGQTAPVTAENDVAPNVEMIKRSEVPFLTEIQPSVRRRRRRLKEKNMQLVTYVNPPNVVPVVLQPINPPNGLSTNQPVPHFRAAQGLPVHSVLPLAVYPPNVSTSQASESQTSSQFKPTGSGNEYGQIKQGRADGQQQVEGAKPVKQTNPDPVVKTESDIADMNEPLFVEPLQTRHSAPHFQPPSVLRSGNLMQTGTGRMTELLQAVQQNLGDDKSGRNGHPGAGFTIRDEETSHHQAGRQ